MMWAVLLLLAVVVGVHWFEYKRSVQEYTFAQPTAVDQHDELSAVLKEKTPIVVEIGALPWRPEVVGKAAWSVVTGEGVEMSSSQWVSAGTDIQNGPDLAEQMGLATGLADLDESRAWWWLPGIRDCSVDTLVSGDTVGLSWVTAERQWIGCSHGGPLLLWLVHSRYQRYLPAVSSKEEAIDPWSLTVEKAPWIGRVQYIEVRVKPGWCIGLPAHWGYAIKHEGTKESGNAWWWTASQHSMASLAVHQWNQPSAPPEEDVTVESMDE